MDGEKKRGAWFVVVAAVSALLLGPVALYVGAYFLLVTANPGAFAAGYRGCPVCFAPRYRIAHQSCGRLFSPIQTWDREVFRRRMWEAPADSEFEW